MRIAHLLGHVWRCTIVRWRRLDASFSLKVFKKNYQSHICIEIIFIKRINQDKKEDIIMHKFSYFIGDEKRCDCLVVGTNLLWGVPKRPSLVFLFFSNWSYPYQTKKKRTMAIVDEMWTNQLANLRTGQTIIFSTYIYTKIKEWRTKKELSTNGSTRTVHYNHNNSYHRNNIYTISLQSIWCHRKKTVPDHYTKLNKKKSSKTPFIQ